MGKSKQKTTQSTTYGWQTPPNTAAQTAFDQHIGTAFDTPDPTIPFMYNKMREGVNNRFDNPFGWNYSPEVADAYKYNAGNEIDMMQGQSIREDAYNRKMGKTQALQASASMHAPVLVATGSSGTTISNPGFGGLLTSGLSAGASLGSAALM